MTAAHLVPYSIHSTFSLPPSPLTRHKVPTPLPWLASTPLKMKSGSFVSQLPSSLRPTLASPGTGPGKTSPHPPDRSAESFKPKQATPLNVLPPSTWKVGGWGPGHSTWREPHRALCGRPCPVGGPQCSLPPLVCLLPSELEDFVEDLKKDSASASRAVTLKDVEDGAFLLRQVGEAVASLKGELPP